MVTVRAKYMEHVTRLAGQHQAMSVCVHVANVKQVVQSSEQQGQLTNAGAMHLL